LEELVQQQRRRRLLLNNMVPSYNAIRHACRKRGINMDMRFCRKIHGSWLHQHGLTAEEVDFLQGRSSISVFSRHYLTPNSSLKDRVIAALEKLKQEIEQ
jgi:intergrase/recombinase